MVASCSARRAKSQSPRYTRRCLQGSLHYALSGSTESNRIASSRGVRSRPRWQIAGRAAGGARRHAYYRYQAGIAAIERLLMRGSRKRTVRNGRLSSADTSPARDRRRAPSQLRKPRFRRSDAAPRDWPGNWHRPAWRGRVGRGSRGTPGYHR